MRKLFGHKKTSNSTTSGSEPSSTAGKWIIKFPDGQEPKFSRASAVTLDKLKKYMPGINISALVSEDDTIFDLVESTGLFYEQASEFPAGIYRILAKREHPLPVDDISRAYCCIRAIDTHFAADELVANDFDKFIVSGKDAPLSYVIAYNNSAVAISINASNLSKLLINAGPHAEVPNVGKIHGSGYEIATLIPFATLFHLCDSDVPESPSRSKKHPNCHFARKRLIFCGMSVSGIVCHIAAIIARIQNPTLDILAITFNSPYFGTRELLGNLASQNLLKNHINLCFEKDGVIDALNQGMKVGYSRSTSQDDAVKEFLENINQLLNPKNPTMNMKPSELRTLTTDLVETFFSNVPELIPLGCHVFYTATKLMEEDNEDGIKLQLQNAFESGSFVLHRIPPPPPLTNISIIPTTEHINITEELTPTITQVRIICTPSRIEILVEGTFLEAISGRQNYKILIEPTQPISCNPTENFPIREPLMVVRSNLTEARFVAIDASYNAGCTLVVHTDFGTSGLFNIDQDSVVKAEEPTPASRHYSKISSEFLDAAFLRGVLGRCYKLPGHEQLLALLFELEEILLKGSKKLPEILAKYPDTARLHYAKNEASREVLSKIMKVVSETIEMDFESGFSRAWKKVLGTFGVIAGGVLTIAAGAAALPGILMLIPVKDSNALLLLPGLIIGGIPASIAYGGYKLAQAGARTFAHAPTQQYLQLLKFLLNVVGGNPLEVLEDISSLETAISQHYFKHSGVALSKATEHDVATLLESNNPMVVGVMKDVFTKSPQATKAKIVMWLRAVGRFTKLRKLLARNIIISFVGVHNAGKSSFLSQLFEVQTVADSLERTEQVSLYRLGDDIYSNVASKDISATLSFPTPSLTRAAASQSLAFRNIIRSLYSRSQRRLGQNDVQDEELDEDFCIDVADFPGVTDERVAVATITERVCDISSLFVCVFTAGHIAGPERKVVEMVQQKGKEVLILINKQETLPDLETRIDAYRKNYAVVLQVPEESIMFTTCLNELSREKVRSRIFDQLRDFSGSRYHDILALLLMPPTLRKTVMPQNQNNLQAFSTAVASLMGNYQLLSEATIKQRMTESICPSDFVPVKIVTASQTKKSQYLVPTKSVRGAAMELLSTGIEFDSRIVSIVIPAIEKHNCSEFNMRVSTVLNMINSNQTNGNALNVVIIEVFKTVQSAINQAVGKGVTLEEALKVMQQMLDESLTIDVEKFMELIQKNPTPIPTPIPAISVTAERIPDGVELTTHDSIIKNLSAGKELLLAVKSAVRFNAAKTTSMLPEAVYAAYLKGRDVRSLTFDERVVMFQQEIGQRHLALADDAQPNHISLPADEEERFNAFLNIFKQPINSTLKMRFSIEDSYATDVGGVYRAVFSAVGAKLRTGSLSAFSAQEDGTTYISPKAYDNVSDTSTQFKALGRLIAVTLQSMATMHANLPAQLSPAIFKILLGSPLTWDDFQVMQPAIAHGLRDICLLDESDIEDLAMIFQVDCNEGSYKLVPKSDTPVTAENRKSYLESVAWFYLARQLPLSDIVQGFCEILHRDLLYIFSPHMLQLLTCGLPEFEVEDLQKETTIAFGDEVDAAATVEVIEWFWSVVGAMSYQDKLLVLAFATGNSSAPPGGFGVLNPKFTILFSNRPPNGLPEAHTCFNMLDIPVYPSKEVLEAKLTLAIHNTNIDTFGMM